MSQFLYLPPYRQTTLFASVSVSDVDSDSAAAYLVDGREKFPLRLTTDNGVITITQTAGDIGLVVVAHHLLKAGSTVTFGGGITGAVTIPTLPRNGVPLNVADILSAVVTGVTSFTATVAGNDTDLLIGELIAGNPLVLDPPIRIQGSQFGERHYGNDRATPLSGIPPYSDRARSRPLGGTQFYSQTQLDLILAWWDSQDGYAYPIPSVIIPDSDDLNDVRLVMLSEPTYSQTGPDGSETQYLVDLEFTELPRTRW